MMGRMAGPMLLAALVLGGCGGSDRVTGPGGRGSFSAGVSGAVDIPISGQALFGTDVDDTGVPFFGVVLGDQVSSHSIVLSRNGTGRPGPGTYALGDVFPGDPGNGWSALYLFDAGGGNVIAFFASSGTITIKESSGSRLRGSFRFEGEGFTDQSQFPLNVSVAGSFDAAPAGTGVLSAVQVRR